MVGEYGASGVINNDATTAIGHLVGCSTAGAALYQCYCDKNASQLSNVDLAATPSKAGTQITVRPDPGYVIDNVTVNGVSKGAVSQVTGLKTGDTVTISFKKAPSFIDVNDHWAKDAIQYVYENGLFTGTSETAFGPADTITREQMASILYRYAQVKGYDVSKTTDLAAFTDRNRVSN